MGAFFLGYVTTNVPGGRMAEKMGGKLIYGLGVFLTAVLTVISPFAAYWGLIPFLVVRVAEGFTEVKIISLKNYLMFLSEILFDQRICKMFVEKNTYGFYSIFYSRKNNTKSNFIYFCTILCIFVIYFK